MNRQQKMGSILFLMLAILMAMPLTTAWARCPSGSRIYIGGPTTNASAIRGSKENPARDMNEAFDICQECRNGAYLYRYNSTTQTYKYAGRCTPEEAEPTGVPLAQTVGMILLAIAAVGLLAWGLYQRRQLKRLKASN
jgi:hypothetical protein